MTRLTAAIVLCWAVAAAARSPDPLPISRDVYLMGTRATLSTYDDDRETGLRRLERLLSALEDTEARISTWREESEVSRINARAGRGPVALSPELCGVARSLDAWVTATDGAFDPAVGPLVAAWDLHGAGRRPADADLHDARARSGWSRVTFDARACTLALPAGGSLDVGAWGKGAALDRARAALGGAAPSWLVDLGGQVAVHAEGRPRTEWTVSLAHPLDRERAALELRVRRGSLATSAGSERDLHTAAGRIGHILDPRSGSPAPFAGSVTVWHEQALAADILSTALFVMGPDEGLRWADARGIAACYLIPDGRRVATRATAAFEKLLTS